MASKLVRMLLCIALLALFFAAASQAQVTLESGKIAARLSNAGSIRLVVPSASGTRQIERVNIIAALSETAVCDYNENHDAGEVTAYQVAVPAVADVEGYVKFDSRYLDESDPAAKPLPPHMLFNLATYMWKDQPFVIARYTVINDSSEQLTFNLGAVAVPRVNGNYGGETVIYDAASQIAYTFRQGEAGYSGVKLLSHAPFSCKSLDWSVYSPEDPNADAASDQTRYHQTADAGFDTEILAGGDGSIYSLNAGAFTIAAHDSVVITYGIVYGDTYDEMVAAANIMQTMYAVKLSSDTKNTYFDSGKLGIRLSNAGSIRLYVPDINGTRQIERINLTVALSENAVCDYNENHNPLLGTAQLSVPTKSDVEGIVEFDSRYIDEADPTSVPLPPHMTFTAHTYMWKDQPWVIAEYTITNDSSEAGLFYIGAVAVPRVNGNYGGESNGWDAGSETAYTYRQGEAGYSGIRLLSGAAYSFKTLDWSIYSPDDPNADASTDQIRYHMTADPGFDAEMVSGGDGSIFSLNAGAVTIPAHGSVKIVFGAAYGESLAELITASNTMKEKYDAWFTAVELAEEPLMPQSSRLSQNWPNPFNPSTAVQFELRERTEVRLAVYNLKGELVNILAAGVYAAGRHQAVWNGRDAAGHEAAAGIYIYRLQAGPESWTRKMTLVR